jgi:hypothetical protein
MKYRKKRKWKYTLEVQESRFVGARFPNLKFSFIEIEDGTMYIAEQYAWDGASFLTFDTKDTMTPTLFHDAFYQLMREGLLSVEFKETADRILYEMMMERAKKRGKILYPFRKLRARLWHWAVDVGGPTSSYVLEAP